MPIVASWPENNPKTRTAVCSGSIRPFSLLLVTSAQANTLNFSQIEAEFEGAMV